MASSGPPPSPSRPPRPSFTQVAASALAAVSAALISSEFGVAGTLIGTGIASVVASVGSTLYLASLRRTNERLRRVAVAARRTDWSSALVTRPGRHVTPATGVTEPELPFPADGGEQANDPAAPSAPSGWSRLRWSNLRAGLPVVRRRWVAVAGLCVLIFAIAIAVLTAIQASTSQRLTAFPASSGSGNKPSPSPTPSTTSTPAPSATPSSAASPTATPSPSASASPTPSSGATSPPGTASPSASPSAGATLPPSPSAAAQP